jgi:hypothetical protein
MRTTSTSRGGSQGYRKTIACASTVSTSGTKRELWSTGRTTIRNGGMWQVGSNTMGGPISNTRCVFLAGTEPNKLLQVMRSLN